LLDLTLLEKFDKFKMYKIYDNWPGLARDSYNLELTPIDISEIDHIIFSGMGGSGILGDVIYSIMSQSDVFVTVNKGYHLPKSANEKTLVVSTSISGNTTETMSVLKSARESKCKTISFSSGGKIQDFCLDNNLDFRFLPMTHSPRSSFVQFLYPMIKTLNPVLNISENEIQHSIQNLEDTCKKISSGNLNETNPSLNLANWITGIPLIYYPWGLQSSAIRFKNSLQENSKRHAMIEDVVESCHNCIVAWDNPSIIQPILIQGKDDHIKTKDHWRALKEFFMEKQIDFYEISSVSGNILSKIINLIYVFDYCSIYLSVISGIDPSPIKPIDFIKSKILLD
jgi:glucose/mannose-6-phosphate isomerase